MREVKMTSPYMNSIPGPDDITRVELPNGIVVLARANFHSPSVTIGGYLQVGSLFDEDRKLGLSDFTADALVRGTRNRSFQQIFEDLEEVSAILGFNGGTHTTNFGGRALVEDIDLLLGILSETLRAPSFPSQEVRKLRAQILTGLALREQNTRDRAALAFDGMVYQGHPYSRPDEGYPKTVMRIRLKDLKFFHKNHYGPQGMVVVVVGGIDPHEAVDKVQAVLGDWHNPDQPENLDLPILEKLKERKTQRVEVSEKSQSDIIIGAAGPPRSEPGFLAATMGNNILGQFGLMGRVGKTVREEAGLAYYVSSSVNGGLGPGSWMVSAGVNPKNEEKAIELILKELHRFGTELVEEEELSDSQAHLIGSMPLSLEANAGVVVGLMRMEKHGLGMDYLQRYPDLIRAITREDILEAASNYLDVDRLAVAIAGPPKE